MMEGVVCFLRFMFGIIILFTCIVTAMKALIVMAHKLCAYIEYFQRVIEMFNANTAALKLIEPVVVTAVKGDATSENDRNLPVIVTGPGKKSKKPFKEKAKIGSNETVNRGRLPIPVCVPKEKRGAAQGPYSIIDIVRKAQKAAPTNLRRSLWPEDFIATRKKGSSGGRHSLWPEGSNGMSKKGNSDVQERNSKRETAEVIFVKENKSNPLWNSTRNPRPWHRMGVRNQKDNTFNQAGSSSLTSKHSTKNSTLQVERPIVRDDRPSDFSTSTASSAPCPIRLWSVDTDEESVKEKPPIVSHTKIYPETKNNKTTLDSGKRSLFLRIVTSVSLMVIDAVQPICDYVDSKWVRFTDVLNRTDRKLMACWISTQWSKAVALCQSTINWAMRRLYGSVTTASRTFYGLVFPALATAKMKVVEKLLQIQSALISLVRADQLATSQELRISSPRKDQEETKMTRKKPERDASMASLAPINAKICDSGFPRIALSLLFDFPVRLFSVEEHWETPVKQPSNSDVICASRGVNNNIDSQIKTPSLNETLRQDSSPRRRQEQSNFSETVDNAYMQVHGQKSQVQITTKCKVKKESSTKSDNPVRAPVGGEKQSKVKTSAQVDFPTTRTRKGKEKVMPRFCVKEKSSSQVEHDAVEDTSVRAKRRHNDLEETYSDKQAPMVLPSQRGMNTITRAREVMKNPFGSTARSRASMKRKAEGNPNETVKPDPFSMQSALQTNQTFGPMTDKATVKQLESMEVVESVEKPFTIQPKAMVVNCKLVEVEESFEAFRAPYYELRATATAHVSETVKPKEPNVDVEMKSLEEKVSSWNFFPFSLPSFLKVPFFSSSQLNDEEMEIDHVQESSWNYLTFSLPSFLTAPFTSQPAEEEMEVDELPILVSPSNAEPEEMEIYSDPTDTTTPLRQPVDFKGAAEVTLIRRPDRDTPTTLPQQRTVKTDNQPFDGCITASPSGEITDTKRPLASTVGLLKEAAMPAQIPTAEHANSPPAVQQLQQPVAKPLMQAGILSAHPQVNSSREASPDCSRALSQLRLGEAARADIMPLIPVLKEQRTASTVASQLTMEPLQLVSPTDDPNAYLADSESDGQSDDEYALDLETIEKFSELESSPVHAQLITKLLMEKETTQWHSVTDSDSDSDCGATCELPELVDPEETKKYSALEAVLVISPAEAERLARSLEEKESRDWYNVSGSDADDESETNNDLIEHLDMHTIAQIPELEDLFESSPQDVKFMVKLMKEK